MTKDRSLFPSLTPANTPYAQALHSNLFEERLNG